MLTNQTVIPIYTTRGDLGALMCYPYIYNPVGEWIGWVTPDRQVYSVRGAYIGWLSNDPRILRKRSGDLEKPSRTPPPAPASIVPPASVPLAPLMPELTYGTLDVLDEDPELLPAAGFGILNEDMG